MKFNGGVSQIRANYGGAFLNLDNAGEQGLWVWTSIYLCPIYICRYGETFHLFQFNDDKSAKEWFDKNNYDSIEKIESK